MSVAVLSLFCLQSYEKMREMQKKCLLFFSFPNSSNFGIAKVTKNRAQNKRNLFLFLPRWSKFAIFDGKVTKLFQFMHIMTIFFCTFAAN